MMQKNVMDHDERRTLTPCEWIFSLGKMLRGGTNADDWLAGWLSFFARHGRLWLRTQY